MDVLTQSLQQIFQTPHAELPSLAVVVVDDGKIVYEQYFGYRSIDSHNPERNKPANRDTKYRVASISKAVVALAIMQLVERDMLDLDRDVSDYLGFTLRNPHYPEIAITARQLLSHTSSLRDGSVYSIPLPYHMRDFFLEDGAFYNEGDHFAAPDRTTDPRPGEFFAYCNLNYGILGSLIEIVSGERFDQYMHNHILHPLGLDAGFGVHQLTDDGFDNLATLYRKYDGEAWHPDGDWVAQVDDYGGTRPEFVVRVENPDKGDSQSYPPLKSLDDYMLGHNGTLFSPQGGLRISATDLATVMQIFINQGTVGDVQILRPETVAEMLSLQWRYDASQANGGNYRGLMRAWGLGLQYATGTTIENAGDAIGAPHQGGMWGHGGEAYGLLSGMWFDPETRKGFVYIMGGVGANPDEHPGQFSSFFLWEEQIMQAIMRYWD